MSRFSVLFLLSFVSVHAVTLDRLVELILKSNEQIKAFETIVQAKKIDTTLAWKLADPEVALRLNDYQVGDFFNRTLEGMQNTSLDVTQLFPLGSRLERTSHVAKAQVDLSEKQLQVVSVALVNAVKVNAYTLWKSQQELEIIKRYERVMRHNIELSQNYILTQKDQHMGIVSAELSLSSLRTKQNTIEREITKIKAMLTYLTGTRIDDLELSLSVKSLPLLEAFSKELATFTRLEVSDQKVHVANTLLEKEKTTLLPDLKVTLSYSNRVGFADYFSMGFGMKLPLYGSQIQNIEKRRLQSLQASSLNTDMKNRLLLEVAQHYANLKNAYETYHIIEDESLPQVEHMFDIAASMVATGGDMFSYITVLKQKLELEEQRIDSIALYNIEYAELEALKGILP